MFAAIIYLTATMPLPIRECDTDSDCITALAEIGCVEVEVVGKPEILFACDRAKYVMALRGRV